MSEWVPVSERLPEDEQEVLFRHCGTNLGVYVQGTFVLNEYEIDCSDVTHWQPLPAPPTEEK